MTVHQLHASYILRLRQRLSRLTFELRDVRTGQTRLFASAKALSVFLDSTVDRSWNGLGTTARHAAEPEEQG